jgi:hypothetical protein
MSHLTDVRLALVPERFRMEIVPLILWCFVDLHLDAMGVGPGVLTDSRHLPGNLGPRPIGPYGKAPTGYFSTRRWFAQTGR